MTEKIEVELMRRSGLACESYRTIQVPKGIDISELIETLHAHSLKRNEVGLCGDRRTMPFPLTSGELESGSYRISIDNKDWLEIEMRVKEKYGKK